MTEINSDRELLEYLQTNFDKISAIANGFNGPAGGADIVDVVMAMGMSLAMQAGKDEGKLARWISYIITMGRLHYQGTVEFDIRDRSEMH